MVQPRTVDRAINHNLVEGVGGWGQGGEGVAGRWTGSWTFSFIPGGNRVATSIIQFFPIILLSVIFVMLLLV